MEPGASVDPGRVGVLAGAVRRVEAGAPAWVRSASLLPREEATRFLTVLYGVGYGLGRGFRVFADELARLAREDPGVLDARELSRAGRGWFAWARRAGVSLSRVDERVVLLRDIGRKIEALYGGEFYGLVVESRGLAGGPRGFLERAADMAAFRSPARVKALKLASALLLAGVLPVHDAWSLGVPPDSRMVGLAVRTGLLRLTGDVLELVAAGVPLPGGVDASLRWLALEAYGMVSRGSGLGPVGLWLALEALYPACSPGGGWGEEWCLASSEPLLRVRDPVPPEGAWWD